MQKTVHYQNGCTFTLCNYAEHELTVEIISLLKVPFFNAKICNKIVKTDIFLKHVKKKKKFRL